MRLKKYLELFTATKTRWFFLVFAMSAPLTSQSGSLLYHIDTVLDSNSSYNVTAQLSIYDVNNVLIGSQQVRAESLFNGSINTGSSILYTGSLSFPEPFPTIPGATGGLVATLSNFEVDLATLSSPTDSIHVQLDWLGPYSFTHEWSMVHGDDFVNGIAYYFYGENYYPGPIGEIIYQEFLPDNYFYADLQMTFASGVAPVPVPPAIWLFGSGLLGLLGVCRKCRTTANK